MEKKKSFKNKSSKQKETCHEKHAILEEKYQKLKDILKQVLKDLKQEKAEREALQQECSKLAVEVKEKEDLLEQMHSVSEAVVDEFSALQAKYSMEAEAASNAMRRATRYFHENQILKGNSQCDSSLLIKSDSDGLSDNTYDENLSEMEILNKINSDLRSEVASMMTKCMKEKEKTDSLQDELNIAKQLYEDEMRQHKDTAKELKSLEILYDSVVQAVNSQINIEESSLDCSSPVTPGLQTDAKTENNNQSKEKNSSKKDITVILNLIEKQRNNLQSRVKELELQISDIKLKGFCDEPRYVPPPPPPPPLPPQPVPFNPFKSLKAMINARKKTTSKETAVTEEDFTCDHQKAISEVVDAIKKGSVKLKPVPKNYSRPELEENEPVAVTEMKTILQTLKKRKKEEPDKCLSDENHFPKVNSCDDESSSFQSSVNQDSKMPDSLSIEDFHEKSDDFFIENISVASSSFINLSGSCLKYSDLLSCDSFNIEDDSKDENEMII